ncbi:MAG: Gfo/Idh/MocA family oxidoreductase [Candidatus Hydrogenedentes bacterium]|nr:Gfo/Idh/MocA family oxidoreductase [Candidatus Hydrogenedentota bacterium]
MKRRQFLGAVAGMLAGPQLLAAGQNTMKRPIPCGILGLGHAHGLSVLRILRESPDYALNGVCEPDPDRRAAFADHELMRDIPWLDQDALLGNPDIQMIAVESDVQRLLKLGRAVVDAGKHLYLDKPAGTSLEEWRALLDAADRQDLLVQMGYMYRYNPGFDFLRKLVKEGMLGDIYSIHASMCTDLSPAKRQELLFHPGGLMLELGCHLIDMIVLLMGEPSKVTSFLRHDTGIDDTLNDNTLAVLEYDNALVTVESGAREPNAFASRRFRVVGTEGSFTLMPLEPPAGTLSLRRDWGEYKKGVQPVPFENLPRHVADLTDLAACIRGESEFAYPTSHDYAVQRTVLRACGEDV